MEKGRLRMKKNHSRFINLVGRAIKQNSDSACRAYFESRIDRMPFVLAAVSIGKGYASWVTPEAAGNG